MNLDTGMVREVSRNLVRSAVQRAIFCPITGCGSILDVDRAILVDHPAHPIAVICARCFDRIRSALPIGTTITDGRAFASAAPADDGPSPPRGPRSRAIAKRLGPVRLGDRRYDAPDDAWNARGPMVLVRLLRKGESAGCRNPRADYTRPAEVWILFPDDRAILARRYGYIGRARYTARALARALAEVPTRDSSNPEITQRADDIGHAEFRTKWRALREAHIPRPADPATIPSTSTGFGRIENQIGNLIEKESPV